MAYLEDLLPFGLLDQKVPRTTADDGEGVAGDVWDSTAMCLFKVIQLNERKSTQILPYGNVKVLDEMMLTHNCSG